MTRRAELESLIERAIDALDRLDGDPEAERDPVEDQGDDELAMQMPISYRAA